MWTRSWVLVVGGGRSHTKDLVLWYSPRPRLNQALKYLAEVLQEKVSPPPPTVSLLLDFIVFQPRPSVEQMHHLLYCTSEFLGMHEHRILNRNQILFRGKSVESFSPVAVLGAPATCTGPSFLLSDLHSLSKVTFKHTHTPPRAATPHTGVTRSRTRSPLTNHSLTATRCR